MTTQKIQHQYLFTREEKEAMAHTLCRRISDAEALEDQKKSSVKDFGLRIDLVKTEISLICEKMKTGEETREIEAHVMFDMPRRGVKTYSHPTTFEFIREETMTAADLQPELPIDAQRQHRESASENPASYPRKWSRVEGGVKCPSCGQVEPIKANVPGLVLICEPGCGFSGEVEGMDAESLFEEDKEATREEIIEHTDPQPIGTPVGEALGAAICGSIAPKLRFNLDPAVCGSLGGAAVIRAFFSEARKHGWKAAQIAFLRKACNACSGETEVADIMAILSPHVELDCSLSNSTACASWRRGRSKTNNTHVCGFDRGANQHCRIAGRSQP